MPAKRQSFAAWVVKERGVRGLWHVMDLVLLWSLAQGSAEVKAVLENPRGSERPGTVSAVCEFAVRTSWGSAAKYWRELGYWRELTGTDSPQEMVEGLAVVPMAGGAEVLGLLWSTPATRVLPS